MAAPVKTIHFGTDGWRGLIADDFTFENVRKISAATAAYVTSRQGAGSEVLIGFDRRFLSQSFAEAVGHVMAAQGLSVKIAQTSLSTPAISFSVVHRKAAWGIMITASHNPALYNGFKLKEARGRSAPPEVTREIESFLVAATSSAPQNPPDLPTFDDARAYEDYLRSRLDMKLLRKYKAPIVFDHLFGAGAGIPERILKGSAATLYSIHTAVDPLFGGLHPEPIESELRDLSADVRRRRAAVGIAFDGDADRLGVVDDKGQYLTPHQVFPLLVLHCIEHKGWKGKIVQAVSLGYLSERIARAFALPFEEVPVGFKHIAERMLSADFLAGGEESGGYAVRGGLPERDGILNGLLFIEMLAARRKTPSQLLKELEKRFGAARFKRIDIRLEEPIRDSAQFTQRISARVPDTLAGESVAEVRTRDGVKVILKSGSWVLMRPSGTEPLIRTYAESDTSARTNKMLAWAQNVAIPS